MSLLDYVKNILEKLPKVSAAEKLDTLTHLLNSLAAKYLQLQLVNQYAASILNKERSVSKERPPDLSAIESLHGARFFFSNQDGIQMFNYNCLTPRTVIGHLLAKSALAASTGKPPSVVGTQQQRTTLLYGPPGVGKSLLLKVLENCVPEPWQCFRICGRTLASSKSLLELTVFSAICHAPCVLILEDIHKITDSPGAVSRLNDKLAWLANQTSENIEDINFVATCARPWELPEELLEHFHTRILMPLPSPTERLALLKLHLPKNHLLKMDEMVELANYLEDFSGGLISEMIDKCTKFDSAELYEQAEKLMAATPSMEEYWDFAESEVDRMNRVWGSEKKIPKSKHVEETKIPENNKIFGSPVTVRSPESVASPRCVGSPESVGSPEFAGSPETVTSPRIVRSLAGKSNNSA